MNEQGLIILHLGEFDASDFEVYIDSTFSGQYLPEWLTSDYAKKAVKEVDSSEIAGPNLIISPVLGPIPPERLSGGCKTLLASYANPDRVYPLSNLGDNCMNMLYEASLERTSNWYYTGYVPRFNANQLVQIYNTDTILTGDEVGLWLFYNAPRQQDLINYEVN